MARGNSGGTRNRDVICTECGLHVDVALRAMSVFCPHCSQRLILEDFKITGYRASRMFATCGNIVVEKSGVVSAPIRAGNLTVRGRVQGNVEARGVVEVSRTGQIQGDVCASRLTVANGAKLKGFYRIIPELPADQNMEPAD